MERDNQILIIKSYIKNFNSHAHVERDFLTQFSNYWDIKNFNSHAHVERDVHIHIYTYTYTSFQLTRSRGA